MTPSSIISSIQITIITITNNNMHSCNILVIMTCFKYVCTSPVGVSFSKGDNDVNHRLQII